MTSGIKPKRQQIFDDQRTLIQFTMGNLMVLTKENETDVQVQSKITPIFLKY